MSAFAIEQKSKRKNEALVALLAQPADITVQAVAVVAELPSGLLHAIAHVFARLVGSAKLTTAALLMTLHELPAGIAHLDRRRHFGFLANACRARKLARIRTALNAPQPQPEPAVEPADYRERYAILTGHRLDLCPVCAGRMVEIGRWPRSPQPQRPPPRCDTS